MTAFFHLYHPFYHCSVLPESNRQIKINTGGTISKKCLHFLWIYGRLTKLDGGRKSPQSEKERVMKQDIQPKYYQCKVTCHCGNTFTTGSTKEAITVEVCSKCHPFYTGKEKLAQARGRVEAFNKKYANFAK